MSNEREHDRHDTPIPEGVELPLACARCTTGLRSTMSIRKKKRRADDEKKGIGRAGRAISAYLERRAKSLPEPGIAGLI